MKQVVVFLFLALVATQAQDFVVSRTEGQTHVLRLTQRGEEFLHHDAVLVQVRSRKGRADTAVIPIDEIQGRAEWVEVLGPLPDSSGIALSLVDARARVTKKHPLVRYVSLRPDADGRYRVTEADVSMWTSARDILQGARMVHKGETKLPIADLEPINLSLEPYSRDLSTGTYALAGIDRIEPMWLLSYEETGALTALNYGYDDDGLPTVQVVRKWYGPLRRIVYHHGAIVGVTSVAPNPPILRVFDESNDSSRFARVSVYSWAGPDADTAVDGRYVMRSMAVLSSCVSPPKQWLAFPLEAAVLRPVRLGFAPGQEGCTASGPRSSVWPFQNVIPNGTICHINATANDASEAPWHFVSLQMKGDAAMRRTFGDFTAGDEDVITSGWLPASALNVMGIPSLVRPK